MKKTPKMSKEEIAVLKDLFSGIEKGDLKKVRRLLTQVGDVEVIGKVPWRNERPAAWTPLLAAVKYDKLEIAKHLVSVGADVHARVDESEWDDLMRGAPALNIACRSGDLKMVELLLESGAEVNELRLGHESALGCASTGGHLPIVELLLAKGASFPETDFDWILSVSVRQGRFDIFKMLVEARDIKVTKVPWLLPHAAKMGRLEIVRYLVERGADIESVCDSDHKNALMNACTWGRLDVVEYLLAQGADPDVAIGGTTAKRWAIRMRHHAAARMVAAASKTFKAKQPKKKGRILKSA